MTVPHATAASAAVAAIAERRGSERENMSVPSEPVVPG